MLTGATCFSGIGAPELGGEDFSWQWLAEFDKSPARILAARFPDVPNLGDVTAADFIERAKALGPLDLLVGGPPCQAFSFAGLRQSLADDRGNLSLRFVEIAHAIRPRNLLVENVPGWPLKAANGKPFHVIKRERDELISLLALIIIFRGGSSCE